MRKSGFTLIELLVVIAIMGLIAGILMVSLRGVRSSARDISRVGALRDFKTALELYYLRYGNYPDLNGGGGSNRHGFTYQGPDCTSPAPALRFDNSASIGFLNILYTEGFINEDEWVDPLNPPLGSIYNCRYIIPKSEQDDQNVQHYFLHCAAEVNFGAAQNDGGTSPVLLEIFSGGTPPWLCVTGVP